MAKVKREIGESTSRGDRLEQVGTYHVTVVEFEATPTSKEGEIIDGWRINLGILDGTAKAANGQCTQLGKSARVILNNPNMSHRDGGEFSQRVQDRFLLVAGLIKEDDVSKTVEFDTDDAVGRQFIAKFVEETYNGKTSIKLSGCDMWHVDDPSVDAIPKDAAYLNQIPKSLRLTAASQAKPKSSKSTPPTSEFSEPTKAESTSDEVVVDDI